MPRGDRRVRFAIIAIGILLIGWGVKSTADYRIEHSAERAAASQYQARPAENDTEAFCRRPENTRTITCLTQEVRAYQDEERAKYDLKAQQEMAEWAFAMFLATILGVMLIAGTLWETSQAARAAKEVIFYQKQDFIVSNPPRFAISQIAIDLDAISKGRPPEYAQAWVFNSGGTPAIFRRDENKVGYSSAILYAVKELPPFAVFEKAKLANPLPDKDRWTSGESDFWIFDNFTTVTPDDVRRALDGTDGITVFLIGRIHYHDSRGSSGHHHTVFCRRYNPQTKRWENTNDPDYEYSA